MMQAKEIYNRIAITLQDVGQDRWKTEYDETSPNLSLQPLLNQAIEAVIYQRPDAVAVTKPVQLEAGAKQSIPSESYQLIEIIRNMGSDGNYPGRTVDQVDRRVIDRFNRNWTTETGNEIQSWAYDPLYDRKTFWVYPAVPSSLSLYVEMTHAPLPEKIATADDVFPLPDIYADPVYHHVLFQILTGDNADANFERGMNHWKIFTEKLGMKLQTDMAFSTGQVTNMQKGQ